MAGSLSFSSLRRGVRLPPPSFLKTMPRIFNFWWATFPTSLRGGGGGNEAAVAPASVGCSGRGERVE